MYTHVPNDLSKHTVGPRHYPFSYPDQTPLQGQDNSVGGGAEAPMQPLAMACEIIGWRLSRAQPTKRTTLTICDPRMLQLASLRIWAFSRNMGTLFRCQLMWSLHTTWPASAIQQTLAREIKMASR